MAEYGFSEINEAKRRVQEMKRRAGEQGSEALPEIAPLIAALPSGRERALALCALYLAENGEAEEALLAVLLRILFN